MMSLAKDLYIPALVFAACFCFSMGLYLILSWYASYRGGIQSRLRTVDQDLIGSRAQLVEMRRNRALSKDGHYIMPILPLNKLVLQSGASLGVAGLLAMMLGVGAFTFFFLRIFAFTMVISAAGAVIAGIGFPVVALRSLRDGRRRRFEEQLPEAIDMIVRSLRAGHAVSVAIAAAGRHMPEPIGSEFRLTAAEISYGLDLETAMVNLRSRVGQVDLALMVLAVSIQSKTGGNLAEVLSNMARIIRARLKLRRKAHALAAEGRFSAIFLSVMPFLLFAVLWLAAPSYYADIWEHPYVKPVLAVSLIWMLIGDYIMYRMVKLRI